MTTNFFLFELNRWLTGSILLLADKKPLANSNKLFLTGNYTSPYSKEKSRSGYAETGSIFCVCETKRTRKLHSGQLHFLLQLHYAFAECTIGIHKILYRLAGVDNSSVVAATEMFSDGL